MEYQRKLISEQQLLWHLTALNNLESILTNGLLSRNYAGSFIDVADQEIIQKRGKYGLGDYVPFHFFRGNPFDGGVLKAHTDKIFCYITIRRTLAKENDYKILPKHPLSSEIPVLYDYDEGIHTIDWELVDKRDYLDRESKIACMAECLAPGVVKPESFFSITVKTEEDKLIVERLSSSILGKPSFHIDMNAGYFNVQG